MTRSLTHTQVERIDKVTGEMIQLAAMMSLFAEACEGLEAKGARKVNVSDVLDGFANYLDRLRLGVGLIGDA